VIDGWHRYMAANELRKPFDKQELVDLDPQAFVVAKNRTRRHMDKGQIALAVAQVCEWKPLGSNQHSGGSALSADPPGKTAAQMAEIAGVGVRTMEHAKAVAANAAPAVREAVRSREISLRRGAEIARLPQEQQAEAIHAPKRKPEAEPKEKPEDNGPIDAEVAALAAAEQADHDALQKRRDPDDRLAAAHAEIEQLKELNAQLERSRQGLMKEKAELEQRCESLEHKLELFEGSSVCVVESQLFQDVPKSTSTSLPDPRYTPVGDPEGGAA